MWSGSLSGALSGALSGTWSDVWSDAWSGAWIGSTGSLVQSVYFVGLSNDFCLSCVLPNELLFVELQFSTFDNETSGFIQFQIISHHIKITLIGLKSRTTHVSSGQIIGQIIIYNEIPVYLDRYIGHEIEKIGALYRFHRGINQNKLGTCLKGHLQFSNHPKVKSLGLYFSAF